MGTSFATAEYDRFVTIMSYGTVLLSGCLAVLILYLSATQPPFGDRLAGLVVGIVSSLFLLGIVVGGKLYALRGYTVDADKRELTIHRRIGRKILTLKPPAEARRLDATEMRRTLRVLGNGGLFSYQGEFRNKTLGSFLMYSTNTRKSVLVKAEGVNVVVSPDDTEGFIAAFADLKKGAL
jgi:hypothetical protein